MKILMVCLGNICRSPLAEGLMKKKLEEAGIKDAIVDSAGTGAWHAGEAPDRRSIAVARKYGLDISKQTARQFIKNDFSEFDFIFAMDETNYKDLISLSTRAADKAKVHHFLPFAGYKELDNVPDPWYGGQDDFETVYSLLDQACTLAVSRILTEIRKA